MKMVWLSWLLGIALLVLVIAAALHFSEAEAFAQLLGKARPGWLLAALALQALTYLAQAQIWRSVTAAAGSTLPLAAAYRLSLLKLLVDQALPSSGLSGSVFVAAALRERGIAEEVTTASIVISASSYLLAYGAALATGLMLMATRGHMHPSVAWAGLLFIVTAAAVSASVIRAAGRRSLAPEDQERPGWWRDSLDLLRRADPRLTRNIRLLALACGLQLAVIALDGLTLWTLLRSLGTSAALGAVFASFMVSSLLRTLSIVPAGLGTFEAASTVSLHVVGVALPVALSATLMFRGFSFWLPMLPATVLSRGELKKLMKRRRRPRATAPR